MSPGPGFTSVPAIRGALASAPAKKANPKDDEFLAGLGD